MWECWATGSYTAKCDAKSYYCPTSQKTMMGVGDTQAVAQMDAKNRCSRAITNMVMATHGRFSMPCTVDKCTPP
jgi:hypothetical protein